MKVVLASHNKGKIQEFTELLSPFHIEIIPQAELGIPEPEETGLTFIENAILKARHATRLSGLPALADDSGLSVDALNGAPGIYSARYAGEHGDAKANIVKLLANMKSVTDEKRTANFHCVLAFLRHENDPTPIVCDGTWHGKILTSPSGEAGFGYDPVFYVPSEKKSAAELSSELKNKISHRGLALEMLLKQLPEKI